MTNLVTQYNNKIYQPTIVQPTQVVHPEPVASAPIKSAASTNLLTAYLQNQAAQNQAAHNIAAKTVAPVNTAPPAQVVPWKNSLKSLFNENKAVIWAINARNFNSKDYNGNGLIDGSEPVGTFYTAVEKLDELKDRGINTIHVLPPHPTGKKHALSHAGSLYSPLDFLDIDELIGGKEGFKYFNDECHKRGIAVMIDLPSCASVDLFEARPELMAFERNGLAKTPQGWNDIRMFNPWADESKRILNPHLLKLHKDYVDMCIELGVDGIRADVARAKPTEFWDILIPYSHKKDPNFGWLGETYTYEDASPQTNMPYDRPIDSLRAGFDMIYGQYHIYHEWKDAKTFHEYVIEQLQMSNQLEKGKSLLGSFATHDDVSPMFNGGADYCMQTSVLQSFMPMLNPYFIDGFEKGDYYVYPYTEKQMWASVVWTDTADMFVHPGKLDIFNVCRPSKGDNPEIGEHLKEVLKVRNKNIDIATHGSYIPLKVADNSRDQIIAFTRHLNGKTLLVVVNKDANLRQEGMIEIPGLKSGQKLVDMVPAYGTQSTFQATDGGLKVNLGKARAHVFEIDTPNIEISGLPVYRQNLAAPTPCGKPHTK